MTCVVAYKENGKIYMGADTIGSDENMRVSHRMNKKVWKKFDMIFGISGSYRIGQLVQYSLEIPEHDDSKNDMAYFLEDFIPSFIKCLKENEITLDEGELKEFNMLIGYKGNIYRLESDFNIGINKECYDVIGSGEDIATGALFILAKDKKLKPKQKIKLALDASSRYVSSVGGTYTYITN